MDLITKQEFEQLVRFVKENYGINLSAKKSLVVGRLQSVLTQKNFSSFGAFYQYLIADQTGAAVVLLLDKLTTNHTFFWREANHFHFFREQVLPKLVNGPNSRKDLRIWSAGCSTGEEPYTLAMIIADYFGFNKGVWDTRILATDISQKVLHSAKEGIFGSAALAMVPKHWKNTYFQKVNPEQYQVCERIKQEVVFRNFNLNNSVFPFKEKFQVIFCRNVMIYFDQPTKRALVQKFYDHTASGGFLFIGHSESLFHDETNFRYVAPAIYCKETNMEGPAAGRGK
jgi:chemotaxis protein methyltransferase CheR